MSDIEKEQAKELRKGEKTKKTNTKVRVKELEEEVKGLKLKLDNERKKKSNAPGGMKLYTHVPTANTSQKLAQRKGALLNTTIDKLPRSKRNKNFTGKAGFYIEEQSRGKEITPHSVKEGYFTTKTLTKMKVRIKFIMAPKKVLIVKKPGDANCREAMHEVIRYLQGFRIKILLEKAVEKDVDLEKYFVPSEETDIVFVGEKDLSGRNIDLIICLGGDGTILWASGLFPRGVPPLVSFELGSLGFLTPFAFDKHAKTLTRIFKDVSEVSLRSRLQVTVKWNNQESIKEHGNETRMKDSCLNEVVAKHPNKMVSLDLFSGDDKLTTVHADGLIVATPTGSTAYSLACGGSMMHPSIPAMMVTPIAPHTLSFRPIVLADSSTLRLVVPMTARTDAHVSLDGRNPVILRKGDELEITVSDFPMAAFTKNGESKDWFDTIKTKFLWNVRSDQKPMNLEN